MKIVFIGGRDIRILGGIENYMYNLASQLASMGHEPIVYCESDHNSVEMVNGFEVRYVKGPKSNLLCKPWVGLKATLRTVFKDKNVDLVHYNAWPPSLWCWIASLAGIPSLMEGHGLEWQRSKYSSRKKKLLKFMERYTARINRHLIMCSEDQVRYFKQTYGKDAVCIPSAVNLPSPDAGMSSDVLNRFSLEEKKYYLFMGRLVQDKNPDYLIRAFKEGAPQGFKLVVAGDNEAMPEYVSSLHNLASDSAEIVFTGAVYGEDKAALLRNAFAFCLPSTVEGLSIALLEAMSYKLPVIASDIPANREVLGDNAFYVRPENEDDLSSALSGVAQCEQTALEDYTQKNYSHLIAEYTWPKIAQKYLDYLISSNLKK